MVFSSAVFLFFFLPLVIMMYYVCPKPGRNVVLLIDIQLVNESQVIDVDRQTHAYT